MQERSFDQAAFAAGLNDSLASGRFRLLLVLDAAPAKLVRLVGYLESVATLLLIDLITVAAYEIGGTTVLVPQRVEASSQERSAAVPAARAPSAGGNEGRLVEGAQDFVAALSRAKPDYQDTLRRLTDSALALEKQGCARLATYCGIHDKRLTLLPHLPVENVGLSIRW